MNRWLRAGLIALFALGILLIVALVVRGLSGDDPSGAASPGAPTPSAPTVPATPSPTPAPVVWAGEVCVARDELTSAVSTLGSNLSYDVTSDRTALEQIDQQLRQQAKAVGDALTGLGVALAGVPVDLKEANDFVVNVTKAKDDTSEAIDATRAHLDAMVNSDNVVAGAAEAAQALAAGKAAYESGSTLVSLVTDGASKAGTQVQAAFDAAPECKGEPGG